jgi:hypothetical protein
VAADVHERFWEEMYRRLRAFRQRYGHTRVPSVWPADKSLGTWVGTQRTRYRRGQMKPELERRLLALGFEFHLLKDSWERLYRQLAEYRKRFGDCDVPRFWTENRSLGLWVASQRTRGREGRLDPERRRRLEELGFTWELRTASWDEHMRRLYAFADQHGHGNVPHHWKEDLELGRWLAEQRTFRRRGRLTAEHERDLLYAGVTFDLQRRHQEVRYQQLVAFKREFGHCNVPEGWRRAPGLATWVALQRRALRRGAHSPLAKKLYALGLRERPTARHSVLVRWEKRFSQLRAFLGSGKRAPSSQAKGREHLLWLWVVAQRAARRKGELSPDQLKRLDGIRFPWQATWDREHAFEREWEAGFAKLLAFRKRNGHVLGPFRIRHPSLSQWVTKQRRRKRLGKLEPKRVARLEALGFQWEGYKGGLLDDPFLDRLADFKRKNGHLFVTASEDPSLARWLADQRSAQAKGALPQRVRRELLALGVPSSREEEAWEQMFAGLCSLRKRHGQARAPAGTALGRWVEQQRALHKTGDLEIQREFRLREVGVPLEP